MAYAKKPAFQKPDIKDDAYKEFPKSQSLPSTPSKMYSPIEKLSPRTSLFVNSPPDKKLTDLKIDFPKHNIVKNLFDGQKDVADSYSDKPTSRKRKRTVKTSDQPVKSALTPILIADFMDSDDSDFVDMDLNKFSEITKTYGLVESNELLEIQANPTQSCKVNYFEVLPVELIESIFCQLPMFDLCLNCNRVCKQWNFIISNNEFLPWKKEYYKQLVGINGKLNVINILAKNKINKEHFVKSFIIYMKDFTPLNYIKDNLLTCLKSHPRYLWAEKFIREYIPECIQDELVKPWSIAACLVILSDSVKHVELILNCLISTNSQCPLKHVLEYFYCMAALLYSMMKVYNTNIWNYLHYRVFYALYLFENDSVSDNGMLQDAIKQVKGQQTSINYGSGSTNVKLTHEQLRIINYNPQAKDIIKIVAFAGTGKTTTLVRYTQLRPHLNFLLVVYNKSVCEHAKTIFPSNVTIKTGHGLAYGVTGRIYAAQKKLDSYALKVYNIAMNLPKRKGDNLFVRAKLTIDTLNNYLASSDMNISTDHTPSYTINDNGGKVFIDEAAKSRYVEDANYLWRRMKDLKDKKFAMSHDGYLKLYQLQNPVFRGYDIILIDEAQDLTPTVLKILETQPHIKILVGDPHQQIYSFRGAVNAMQHIPATKTFYLTQSFRFGPEIAYVAASCLRLLKGVKNKTIVGHGQPGKINGEVIGQVAIIARCNFTLFVEAVKKCCFNGDSSLKVGFVGGTNGFGFPTLRDIYTLLSSSEDRAKENRVFSNAFISKFSNIGELEKYANKTLDHELLGKVRIVRTYTHSLPSHINKIMEKAVDNLAVADIIFSTAHKSKGLEFSTVKVTDDFNYLGPESSLHRVGDAQISLDESNLLYVAITRAKHALIMSPDVLKILKHSGMLFENPVLSDDLKQNNIPFTCHITHSEFTPKLFTVQKQTVKLSCGTTITGGLISPRVLFEDYSPFRQLLGEEKPEEKDKERH